MRTGVERPARIGAADHAVGAALTVTYVLLLMATSSSIGMARDEGFYVEAAESYAGWFRLLFDGDDGAFDGATIDRFWTVNHEHPSLPKSLFALSWLAQERFDLFPDDSLAFRFPGMVLTGLVLWILYLFGARAYSRFVGLFAAAAYAFIPSVFYHAHLDCFDGPIVTMLTWVTYLYWRSLTRPRFAILAGIAYGLCLETKHNAWILPLVLLVHFLGFVMPAELAARRAGARPRVHLRPDWLVAFVLMGPPIFVALWPWLWHDTVQRFGEYAGFHLNHVHYNTAYLGTTYFGAPGPASFPWVMTLFTVPLVTVVLGLSGIGLRLRAMMPPGTLGLWPTSRDPDARPVGPDPARTDALLLGTLLAPMVVLSMPWTPIFGGNKHFLAAFAMLAIFAGIAAERVAAAARAEVRERAPRWLASTVPMAFLLLLAPSLHETEHSHPFGLSHYSWIASGPPGAADLGMMRQFWGFTTGSLAPWLNEHAPERSTVWLCDTVPTSFEMLHRDGLLRRDIRPAFDMAGADFAIVHHEDHFNEVDYQIWMTWGRPAPVHVLTYDGVPIISVYENPGR
jgi:4-amino-4-deoxy-L-arabinose transferase-like glycosyltransferase